MEELQNIERTENTGGTPVKRKIWKTVKRALAILLSLFVAYTVYTVVKLALSPARTTKQIYLVPADAVFIIQSNEPVNDWKKISESDIWRTVSRYDAFADIDAAVQTLDSTISANKTLLSLVGERDMIISLHKTGATKWDFLAIVDMKKLSKVDALKGQLDRILRMAGNTVTSRTYNGIGIIGVQDPDTHDILYMAFVDNHFVASYEPRLVQASIDERHDPKIWTDNTFISAGEMIGNQGQYRIFINYACLPQFLSIYFKEENEYLDIFTASMEYAGFSFEVLKDRIEIKGYTFLKDDANPYLEALLRSGSNKMKAHEVMPARTAAYVDIGFYTPTVFVKELEKALEANDTQMFELYRSSRDRIENYFGISLERNLLDWMAGEFAVAQLEPGLLGLEPETVLMIRARDIKLARKNMEFIEKQVKRRSPVKIKNVEYKGYPINHIEMKGFFKLFFGGYLDKFEKPFYTYVGNYVVFTNKVETLLSFVEDHEQKNLLKSDAVFKKAFSRANSNSTIFAYLNTDRMLPVLRSMLTPKSRQEIDTNSDLAYAFPDITLQIKGGGKTSMRLIADYAGPNPNKPSNQKPENTTGRDETVKDSAVNEDAETDKELMSELQRFHIEKFQGNVLREFYIGGALKSEQEIHDGQRHGRYREYYEDGVLRIRGRYSHGSPRGTWKYYTPDGKFERKEKK